MAVSVIADYGVQLLLAIGIAASLLFYCVALVGGWDLFQRSARRRTACDLDGPLPGVTILKPLKGLEPELYENLSSYCRLDYPEYQIIFGVRDADDPAIALVRCLQSAHPQRRIDLIIDGRVYGTNYKISNLHNMYRTAAHDVLVIADSDVRVPADYLRRLVTSLRAPGVGVVSCLYRAARAKGLPATLEALSINTDFSPMVLVARMVEQSTYAFGATMAVRRTTLDAIGGFLPLANVLADDYHVGQRIIAQGSQSVLSDLVVETVIGAQTWERVFHHQLRWARTYRTCRPRGYFFSIVTHGTLWATANLLYHQSAAACFVAVTMYAVRVAIATRITSRYLGIHFSWAQRLLIPVKDLLVSLMWLLSYLGDTVVWSGNRFRVWRNGEMVLVTPEMRTQTSPTPYPPSTSRGSHTASA